MRQRIKFNHYGGFPVEKDNPTLPQLWSKFIETYEPMAETPYVREIRESLLFVLSATFQHGILNHEL